MESKIIKAVFGSWKSVITQSRVRYDYGQVIEVVDIELPETFETRFSNAPTGESIMVMGTNQHVSVPDELFQTGEDIWCYITVHDAETDGRTMYTIKIPVRGATERTSAEPTPVEQDIITQTIAALNNAVSKSETNVTHYPKISDGTWQVWAADTSCWVDTGVHAQGERGETGAQGIQGEKGDKGDTGATGLKGEKGDAFTFSDFTPEQLASLKGQKGDKGDTGQKGDTGAKGEAGVSPTVTITHITGGHRITITDADGQHSADVMDGDDYTLTQQDKQDIAELVDLSDCVKNTDYATSSNAGIVNIVASNGVDINANHVLTINKAATVQCKEGIAQLRPIVPSLQDRAAFYGLAKAAGHDERYSALEYGTYTPEAKAAIRKMLGIDTDSLVAEIRSALNL